MTELIQADAAVLTAGIYIGSYDYGGGISIECNWCVETGSQFFRGPHVEMSGSKWLELATVHLTTEHARELASPVK